VSVPRFLRALLRRSCRALGADGLSLLAYDGPRREFSPVAGIGLGAHALITNFHKGPLRAGGGFLRRIVVSGKPAPTHAPRRLELLGGARNGRTRAGCAVVVPLQAPRRVHGCLVALWRVGKRAAARELLSLRVLGETLAPLLSGDALRSGEDRIERSRQLRAFYRICRLASAAEGPEDVGPRILKDFCEPLGFSRAEIWLMGPERHKMRLLCTYGQAYALPPRPVNIRDCPFTMLLMRRRQGIHHPDVCRNASARSQWAPWESVSSVFGAPLRARGRVIGTICADRHGERFEMTAADLELATVLAALTAEVIDGSIERQARAKRHRQMILLNRASRVIGVEGRLAALLSRLARIVRAQAGCLGVVIRLHDERARALRVVAAAGPGAGALIGQLCPTRRGRASLTTGVLSFVSKRPILINRARPLLPSEAYWPDVRSALVIPIRARERPLGVLRLEAARRFTFDEEDVKVFSILGEQIGHVIERARALETLRRKQADLTALSANQEKMLEEDRRRIARELHDELAQAMTAARINLGILQTLTGGDRPEVQRVLGDTAALIDRTIAETRRISMDLRPVMLDDLGLVPALRWYTGTFAHRTGIRVALKARSAEPRMRRGLETLLYRFVQEALTNVARHARARQVQISLVGQDGSIRAVVSDDGVGMPSGSPKPAGLGLLGMRERIERTGGTLRIISQRGAGTRLEATVPLEPAAGARPEPGSPPAVRGAGARRGTAAGGAVAWRGTDAEAQGGLS